MFFPIHTETSVQQGNEETDLELVDVSLPCLFAAVKGYFTAVFQRMLFFALYTTIDGRNPKQPPGMYKTL